MQYIKGLERYLDDARTAITLGKFDGLHRGHQKLIERIRMYQEKDDVKSVVFAFDMSPLYKKLNTTANLLLTNEERRQRLEGLVDYLVECPFTEDISGVEAERFIQEILVEKFHVKYVVVGTDFHFGHNKRGDYHMLEKYQEEYGYRVEVVQKIEYHGREISSTYIKEELQKGNMELVDTLLGYPYESYKGYRDK